MKNFSFKLKDLNPVNNNSAADDLRDLLKNNIVNKYPFLGGTNKDTNCPFMCNNCPIVRNARDYTFNPRTITKDKNIYLYFDNGDLTIDRDDYDFMLGDTPVKDYGNFVQVGYNIVPRDAFPMNFYLNNNHRVINKTVIDIIIKIKKHNNFYLI